MHGYHWTRQGWMPQTWTLHDGHRDVAQLQVDGWGRRASLRSGDDAWTLRLSGFWTTTLIVDDQDGVQVGHARGLGRRAVALAGFGAGPATWRAVSVWTPRYELHDAHGRVLARFRGRGRQAEAEVLAPDSNTPILLAVMLLSHLRAQAAATSTVIVTTT